MHLLIDSDAFCKFAATGLLEWAVRAINVDMSDCARLAALPYMLRRGRLRHALGVVRSDALLALAEAMAVAPVPEARWADQFVGIPDVDPGEAQLFSLAAANQLLLLTGDKRALSAVVGNPTLAEALRNKIVLPEVVLFRLCEIHGDQAVRAAVSGSGATDVMWAVAFSTGNLAPREALRSYIDDACRTLAPLDLWVPPLRPGLEP